MPRIQLLSDLHFEFHRDKGREFLRCLDPSDVDVLVLAGDIDSFKGIADTLWAFCDLYPLVAFVNGNHELYGASPSALEKVLHGAEAKLPNLRWLNRSTVEVGGVRFVGTTLWFPKPPLEIYQGRHNINDFNLIKGFEPWVYEENKKSVNFLIREAGRSHVVVTHHIPANGVVDPPYKDSPFNSFFVCPMDDVIERHQPPFWLYGHTHTPAKHEIGKTRLLCNSFGYPHESKAAFEDKLVIEVSP
jgi:Icc-related predicted phosphoesterase